MSNIKEIQEELREIHDRIKSNKYRENIEVNTRYYKSYYSDLRLLLDTFWNLCRKGATPQLRKVVGLDFYHDFFSAITTSRAAAYWLDRDEYGEGSVCCGIKDKEDDIEVIKKKQQIIEDNLSAIHCFIETGYFNTYYHYMYKDYVKEEWNEDTQSYEMEEM